jgi:peroxiredoxin
MTTLKAEIDAYNAEKAKRLPAEVLATMAQATEDLLASGIEKRALRQGDRLPDFELPDQHGRLHRIHDYLQESPLVINVYRGGWCPYCNMEMKALHAVLPEIESQGARLIGLAPESPEHAAETAARHEIDIDILSDSGNQIADLLGLVFELPETLRGLYAKIGIDIPAYNGDESFRLPVPATYIVDQTGLIAYDFVNADYTRRLEPSEIVAALAAMKR